MKIRLEYMKPEGLGLNPENFKIHPDEQRIALEGVIREVGWADALVWNERTGQLVDGHLRREVSPELLVDGKVPVIVGSWTEEQERALLATLDPTTLLAEVDADAFREILESLEPDDESAAALVEQLAAGLPDLEIPFDEEVDIELDDDAADESAEEPPKPARIAIGPYSTDVPRERFNTWLGSLVEALGDDAAAQAEIRRRLEL